MQYYGFNNGSEILSEQELNLMVADIEEMESYRETGKIRAKDELGLHQFDSEPCLDFGSVYDVNKDDSAWQSSKRKDYSFREDWKYKLTSYFFYAGFCGVVGIGAAGVLIHATSL